MRRPTRSDLASGGIRDEGNNHWGGAAGDGGAPAAAGATAALVDGVDDDALSAAAVAIVLCPTPEPRVTLENDESSCDVRNPVDDDGDDGTVEPVDFLAPVMFFSVHFFHFLYLTALGVKTTGHTKSG